jgi:hypothetical protein
MTTYFEKHGARIKIQSPTTGLWWVWYGGHGIHGYTHNKEIAFFNSAKDLEKENLSEEHAKEAVKNIAESSPERQAEYASDEPERDFILKKGKRFYKVKV